MKGAVKKADKKFHSVKNQRCEKPYNLVVPSEAQLLHHRRNDVTIRVSILSAIMRNPGINKNQLCILTRLCWKDLTKYLEDLLKSGLVEKKNNSMIKKRFGRGHPSKEHYFVTHKCYEGFWANEKLNNICNFGLFSLVNLIELVIRLLTELLNGNAIELVIVLIIFVTILTILPLGKRPKKITIIIRMDWRSRKPPKQRHRRKVQK